MSKRSASVTGYKPFLFTYLLIPTKFRFSLGSCSRGPSLCPPMSLKAMLRTGQRARSGRAASGAAGAQGDDALCPRCRRPCPLPLSLGARGAGAARARPRRLGGAHGAAPSGGARGRRGRHLPGAPGLVRLWMDGWIPAPRTAPGTSPHLPTGGTPPPPQKHPAGRPGHRFCKRWRWHTRASVSLFSGAVFWPKIPPVLGGLSQSLPYLQEARLIDFLSMAMNLSGL